MDRLRQVEDRVAEFIELREENADLAPETFADRYPDLAPDLIVALQSLYATEAMLPTQAADVPGMIGRFTVLDELGRGGMGRVFRVRDNQGSGEEFALKLLNPSAELNPRALERFRREGEALCSLDHPGIVRVHELGQLGPSPYLVMDLVQGEGLDRVISRSLCRDAGRTGDPSAALGLGGTGAPHQRVARLMAHLARAVEAIHRVGILHRDLKPSNVIVTPNGRPVLLDFGLVGGEDNASLTRTGDLLGTPQYMAPEQARGERADERTDVYGLGAILYELLTLLAPHEGRDPVLLLETIRTRPIRRLRSLAPGVPRPLARIVHRCLAHRRTDRVQSAGRLAEELERFLEEGVTGLRSAGTGERVADLLRFHRTGMVRVGVLALVVCLSWAAVRLGEPERRRGREDLYRSALLAWADGAEEEGRSRLDEVLEGDSEHGPARLLRAVLDGEDAPEFEEAWAALTARAWNASRDEDHGKAEADLRAAIALDGTRALPMLLLIDVLDRRRDTEALERELATVLRLLPESAGLHLEHCAQLYALKEFEACIEAAHRATDLDPDRIEAYFLEAKACYQIGAFQPGLDAIEAYSARSTDDSRTSVLNVHGSLLDRLGRHREARVHYERVLEMRPKAHSVLFSIATSYDYEHRPLDALQTYYRALEAGAEARALICLAYMHAGARGEECCECLEVYGRHPELLDLQKAAEYAAAAVSLDARGDDRAVLGTVGMIAAQLEDPSLIVHAVEAQLAVEEDDGRIVALQRLIRQLTPGDR